MPVVCTDTRTPGKALHIDGVPHNIASTCTKPKVSVDMKRIVAKGAGAAALAILNPLLMVLPLIDEGPGKDSDCGKLIAELSSAAKTAAKKPPAASVGSTKPEPRAAGVKPGTSP